ncbi:DUF6125 family protein [Leptospira wolffii]|uniref:DUF6125 family protein n=1 Tax=Leptospira wolffii TaxID=409998 RepID=UPI0002D80190|nr:DUF6125 family protein [Leptospira wolffii]EPG64880.1 hypothetical protein LEP1GSC061_3290 [Leptospira wolffii serovar Khorat str. Khorat-H2]
MTKYEDLGKETVRELLNANWMTHDALWFANCIQEFGIEKANLVNKASVRMMAKAEAKRLRRALQVRKVRTFQELEEFIDTGFRVIRGNFMDFEILFERPSTIIWKVPRCFAYEGVKRLGYIESYHCGIVDRMAGWLDELGISYEIDPVFGGCLKHTVGRCEMRFSVKFPNG